MQRCPPPTGGLQPHAVHRPAARRAAYHSGVDAQPPADTRRTPAADHGRPRSSRRTHTAPQPSRPSRSLSLLSSRSPGRTISPASGHAPAAAHAREQYFRRPFSKPSRPHAQHARAARRAARRASPAAPPPRRGEPKAPALTRPNPWPNALSCTREAKPHSPPLRPFPGSTSSPRESARARNRTARAHFAEVGTQPKLRPSGRQTIDRFFRALPRKSQRNALCHAHLTPPPRPTTTPPPRPTTTPPPRPTTTPPRTADSRTPDRRRFSRSRTTMHRYGNANG